MAPASRQSAGRWERESRPCESAGFSLAPLISSADVLSTSCAAAPASSYVSRAPSLASLALSADFHRRDAHPHSLSTKQATFACSDYTAIAYSARSAQRGAANEAGNCAYSFFCLAAIALCRGCLMHIARRSKNHPSPARPLNRVKPNPMGKKIAQIEAFFPIYTGKIFLRKNRA